MFFVSTNHLSFLANNAHTGTCCIPGVQVLRKQKFTHSKAQPFQVTQLLLLLTVTDTVIVTITITVTVTYCYFNNPSCRSESTSSNYKFGYLDKDIIQENVVYRQTNRYTGLFKELLCN